MSETAPTTMIDRVINYVAPVWGLKRAAARDALALQATFRGGVQTRTSTPFGTGQRSYVAGGSARRASYRAMRDRARTVYANNPIARSMLNTEVDNVVADGFTLQARTSSDAFNDEAEDRWRQWLEIADLRGTYDGIGLQREPYRLSRQDGDHLILLVSQGVESRLQLILGDMVDQPRLSAADRRADVRDGVRISRTGRPTGYYITTYDEKRAQQSTPVNARDVIFIGNDMDPLDVRGKSVFSTVFELLDQVNEYVDAVVVAARMAAIFGLIFKEQTAGTAFGGLGTATNSAGNAQKAVTLENGSLLYKGAADDVVQVQAQQPMTQTPDFVRAMMRLIGQPFDMPLELVAKDMSTVNFSSARIGLLQYYRSARVKQRRYASHWSRIYRWWISRERQKQQAGVSNAFVTSFPKDEYLEHNMIGRGWQYTDPVSEAQGDLLNIELGRKSPQMVAAESGEDFNEVQRQKREAGWPTDPPKSSMTRDATSQQQVASTSPNDAEDQEDDDAA